MPRSNAPTTEAGHQPDALQAGHQPDALQAGHQPDARTSITSPATPVVSGHRRPVQVRLHGRGGQGVVTAAELLAVAAFHGARYAQAFPSFGSERSGAPVAAFCRISDTPIRTRAPVLNPDILVVQDATLVHQVDLFNGLGETGLMLINTSRSPDQLGLESIVTRLKPGRVITVAATELALTHLGRPLPGAALLGALAAASDAIGIDALTTALSERFSGSVGAGNVAAALAAYQNVSIEIEEAPARAARN
jgi:pyruvate ferredoxin oxidoreductase gamma subunit